MAKIDETSVKVEKKNCGKKRKSEDQPLATKNFIMSADDESKVESVTKKENKKRKQPEERDSLKRSKLDSDADASDEEIREPTKEELAASEQIKSTIGVDTIRQKKKNKHKTILDNLKDQANAKENSKNKEYLTKWKQDKSHWKFEKLRQISIQLAVLDDQKIDDEIWPIALEYLTGTKGAAKKKITDLAEDAIQKIDDEIEKTGDKSLINCSRYQRAREIMQNLD